MGEEGEATLIEQLSDLIQDKAMAVEELNFLYSYRFGFNLNDALKFIGFEGTLQDFFGQQKRLSMHDGLISVTSQEASPRHPLPCQVDCNKSGDNETTSSADTKGTTDAESWCFDIDPDLDVIGWHTVGSRLVAALNSSKLHDDAEDDDVTPFKVLGTRVFAGLHADSNEEVVEEAAPNRASWEDVGCRLALACQKSSDGEIDQ